VYEFVEARKWGRYHNPKDLAAAIIVEAAELVDLFKWRDAASMRKALEDPAFRESVSEELADVLIYCLTFAQALGIDISDSVTRKIKKNSVKYPLSRSTTPFAPQS
jgi:NTP pyrophosphatase (non-canonical NTP hydrolase)